MGGRSPGGRRRVEELGGWGYESQEHFVRSSMNYRSVERPGPLGPMHLTSQSQENKCAQDRDSRLFSFFLVETQSAVS